MSNELCRAEGAREKVVVAISPSEPSEPQDGCPTCGNIADDPSFCLSLNNVNIHQALALPGAPCAPGPTENDSAFIFAETTWKLACAAIFPSIRYQDHVPEYLLEGWWKKHPFVLHRLKSAEANRIIKELQIMYAFPTNLGVAGVAPPSPSLQGWSAAVEAAALSPVGELLVMRGGSEYHLVSELVAVGVFRM